MLLGRVLGKLWGPRRCETLKPHRLLLIEPLMSYNLDPPTDCLVATDTLGADVGQEVIITFGEPARLISGSRDLPVEAAVLAIVDDMELSLS